MTLVVGVGVLRSQTASMPGSQTMGERPVLAGKALAERCLAAEPGGAALQLQRLLERLRVENPSAVPGGSGVFCAQDQYVPPEPASSRLERGGAERVGPPGVSSGSPLVDACLPAGGYLSGTLVEMREAACGGVAGTLAIRQALAAVGAGQYLVVIDGSGAFFPPAAAALGVDLKRLIVVRPKLEEDRLWALEQALRSPAAGGVVAWLEQLEPRWGRRLQLSAQTGGGLGCLVRTGVGRGREASWSHVQWLVEPLEEERGADTGRGRKRLVVEGEGLDGAASERAATRPTIIDGRRFELCLLRCRGGQVGRRLRLRLDGHGRLVELPPVPVSRRRRQVG
jgi:protein ImuA